MAKLVPKDYMGDGIYIRDNGFCVVLTTENGISVLNSIVIGPLAWEAIKRYMECVEERRDES